MLMAQAIRPPASPVGSVLSDTHSMNPGNGASSSILPGSEEGIGGRHGSPTRSRSSSSTTSGSKTLLTSMLDDTGLRLAVEQAMARPKRRRFCRRTNGWALDREGHPITDPKAGLEGQILPAIELVVTAPTGTRMGFEASSLFVDEGDKPGSARLSGHRSGGRRQAAKSTRSALKPAFGHAAGRKCPLARATAAAILPTGRVGKTESF
jgi:hypothetical protein